MVVMSLNQQHKKQRITVTIPLNMFLVTQKRNVSNIVLPHFRGHTIIVVEIQQEVFMTKANDRFWLGAEVLI